MKKQGRSLYSKAIANRQAMIKAFFVIAIMLLGYGAIEHHETKKLIDISNQHIDDDDHIRYFWAINDTKNLGELHARTEQALWYFDSAKSAFGTLTLYTPTARTIRDEYLQGLEKLHNNLNAISKAKAQNDQNQLASLQRQVRQSEQILLNARERLANLSSRHLLSERFKMG